MRFLFLALVAITAALHVYIAYFEIFAWTTRGPEVFDTFPPDLFEQTTALGANQGVYNAFLSAGLLWALTIRDRLWQHRVAAFFLGCVLVAGIAAALTVSLRPGLFQIVPATLGLVALVMSRRGRA